jgi:hypothetical protein
VLEAVYHVKGNAIIIVADVQKRAQLRVNKDVRINVEINVHPNVARNVEVHVLWQIVVYAAAVV